MNEVLTFCQQIVQDGLAHVEATRHVEEPWRREGRLLVTTATAAAAVDSAPLKGPPLKSRATFPSWLK